MSKVKRPDFLRGLTRAQIDALGRIAIGDDGFHHPKTLAVLERRGLIVRSPELRHFVDGLPPMTIDHWEMPISIHIRWCEYCSALVDAGELEEEA